MLHSGEIREEIGAKNPPVVLEDSTDGFSAGVDIIISCREDYINGGY